MTTWLHLVVLHRRQYKRCIDIDVGRSRREGRVWVSIQLNPTQFHSVTVCLPAWYLHRISKTNVEPGSVALLVGAQFNLLPPHDPRTTGCRAPVCHRFGYARSGCRVWLPSTLFSSAPAGYLRSRVKPGSRVRHAARRSGSSLSSATRSETSRDKTSERGGCRDIPIQVPGAIGKWPIHRRGEK